MQCRHHLSRASSGLARPSRALVLPQSCPELSSRKTSHEGTRALNKSSLISLSTPLKVFDESPGEWWIKMATSLDADLQGLNMVECCSSTRFFAVRNWRTFVPRSCPWASRRESWVSKRMGGGQGMLMASDGNTWHVDACASSRLKLWSKCPARFYADSMNNSIWVCAPARQNPRYGAPRIKDELYPPGFIPPFHTDIYIYLYCMYNYVQYTYYCIN